jgi:hypothetical protein
MATMITYAMCRMHYTIGTKVVAERCRTPPLHRS